MMFLFEKIQNWVISNGSDFVFSFITFFIISFIGIKISLFIIDSISKKIDPTALHWKLTKSVIKVLWAFVFIFGVIETVPALDKLGTAIIAGGSAAVVAIGLASQDAIGDAIDGVFISIFKPFSVGDRVKLISRDITGTISDINLRYTSIKTIENNVLMIPNSLMNDEIIENDNMEDPRIKAFLDVQISYESDVKLAKKLLTELIINHPLFVDNRTEQDKINGVAPVSILLRNLSSNGIDLRATVCSANINNSFILCSDLREQLLIVFKENGIIIPYHTVTVIQE